MKNFKVSYCKTILLFTMIIFLQLVVKAQTQKDSSFSKLQNLRGNKVTVKVGSYSLIPNQYKFKNGIGVAGNYIFDLNVKSKILINAAIGINSADGVMLGTLMTTVGYRCQISNFSVNANIGYMEGIIGDESFSFEIPKNFGFSVGTAYDFPLKYGRSFSLFADYHRYGRKLNFGSLHIGVGYSFRK